MAAVAFRAIRFLLGLLLLSGSYTTSALSTSQRRTHPAILVEERTTINDYDDDDDDDDGGGDDDVVVGQAVYDGQGRGWTSIKLGSREPVEEEVPAEVDDEDNIRYVYRGPEVNEEKRDGGGVTKRKSLGFMGLDNVDYVASTLDLHRTLVGGRNNNNNNNNNNNAHGSNGPSSGTPDDPRTPLATPTRHRTNHRPSMTSRFPLSSNVSPSDMRRMMKTLLDAGKRRR